jgi:hypothetical protein
MALPPVIILPISYFAFKEKNWLASDTRDDLAIIGVAILFLHNLMENLLSIPNKSV